MFVHVAVGVCSLCFHVTLSLLLMVLLVDVCSFAPSYCCWFMSLAVMWLLLLIVCDGSALG